MRTTTRYLLAFIVITACGGSDATAPTSGTTGTGGTGSTGGTGATGGTTGTTTPTQSASVTITDNMFTPTNVTILKGGTVTWTWDNTYNAHNVTFDSGETSGDMSGVSSYQKTFASSGTFTFRCTNHSGMTGTVVVQ
jgi:plastocyanin